MCDDDGLTSCLVQLAKVNLSLNDLICFDEIIASPVNAEELIHQKTLQVTLCDHNALAANLESTFGPAVVEIMDHHADRAFYPWLLSGSSARNIAFEDGKPTVMSTCTLVAEAFWGDGCRGEAASFMTEEVATLLLAVIAVDSADMANATDRDEAAAKVSADDENHQFSSSAEWLRVILTYRVKVLIVACCLSLPVTSSLLLSPK